MTKVHSEMHDNMKKHWDEYRESWCKDVINHDFEAGYEIAAMDYADEIKALKEQVYQLKNTGTCKEVQDEMQQLREEITKLKMENSKLSCNSDCKNCKYLSFCRTKSFYERSCDCNDYGRISLNGYSNDDHYRKFFKYEPAEDAEVKLFKGGFGSEQGSSFGDYDDNICNDTLEALNEYIYNHTKPSTCISIIVQVDNNETSLTRDNFIIVGDKYKTAKGFGLVRENSRAVKMYENLIKRNKRKADYKHESETEVVGSPYWYSRAGLDKKETE